MQAQEAHSHAATCKGMPLWPRSRRWRRTLPITTDQLFKRPSVRSCRCTAGCGRRPGVVQQVVLLRPAVLLRLRGVAVRAVQGRVRAQGRGRVRQVSWGTGGREAEGRQAAGRGAGSAWVVLLRLYCFKGQCRRRSPVPYMQCGMYTNTYVFMCDGARRQPIQPLDGCDMTGVGTACRGTVFIRPAASLRCASRVCPQVRLERPQRPVLRPLLLRQPHLYLPDCQVQLGTVAKGREARKGTRRLEAWLTTDWE